MGIVPQGALSQGLLGPVGIWSPMVVSRAADSIASTSASVALMPHFYVRSCYHLTCIVTLTTNLDLSPWRVGGPTDGLALIVCIVSDMRLDMA